MPTLRAATAAFAAILALAACGGHSKTPSYTHAPSPTATAARVEISGFSYHPPTITVHVGARIRFTNHDQTAHTATATNGTFDTGSLDHGATRTITFRKAGVYTYYCQFHAFMRATITVK